MKLYIILGYLGSGKTTFLYSFMEHIKNMRNVVIVNDFGDDDVDGIILDKYRPETVYGGSMFCSCKSDKFVDTAIKMASPDIDNMVVEASGFANPFTLNELLTLVNSKSNSPIALGGVITIVDATNFEKILTTLHMTKMQIAFADMILINKTDLVDGSTIERITSLIKSINPNAKIEPVQNSKPSSYDFPLVAKTIPQNVHDMILSKCSLSVIPNTPQAQIDELSSHLAVFAHRIKGTVTINDTCYVYQYDNGKSVITENKSASKNTLVVLSANANLKKNILSTLEKFPFAKIKAVPFTQSLNV